MKRVRFLAVIMVAALMMMGVGYAAWTDTLTLTTTVKTGEFDMQFMKGADCRIDWDSTNDDEAGNEVAVDSGFSYGSDNDSATITLSNLYPDAKGDIYLKVGNYGTIPAKIEDITVNVSATGSVTDDFQDHFVVKGAYSEDGSAYTQAISSYGSLNSFVSDMKTALATVQLAQAASGSPSADGDLYLKIPFKLADTVNGVTIGEDEYEKASITITINFNWKQFNV